MESDSLANLEKWSERATQQLDMIATNLKEMERLLENVDSEDVRLMEFLQSIDYIQQKHEQIVTKALTTRNSLNDIKQDIELQMRILQSTLQLMEMESSGSA